MFAAVMAANNAPSLPVIIQVPAGIYTLTLGELEQVQGPLDVDVMRGHRRELRACREQRREVEHAVHFELGEHPVEEGEVGDRAGELAAHERR